MFLRILVTLLPLPRREVISLEATGKRHPALSAIMVFAVFLSPLIVSLTPCTLRAQSWNSHLEGLITDPSGGVILQAQVTVINNASVQVRHTQTDQQGFYNFPLMPVGVYDLTVAVPGFATRTVRGLSLQVGQSNRVDLTLQLARGQAVMQVEARPPLVQAASPAIGDEISNQRVTSLPLNGRQFSQLALLAAGAVPPYPNGATQQFNTPGLGLGFSVDGQRSERNNFSLDGITLIEPFAYSLTVSPSADAIREFRVVENSYSADQGLVSGAQVNIVSRSGSNRFAGTAYEFLRNSALDAKNYFDDRILPIPPFRQNQYGTSLAGPLRRNSTFFFTEFEGFRIRQSLTNTTLLPTASEREGDFSGTNPATGQPFPAILNPATGQTFTGNQILPADMDTVSLALLARVPLPNQANAVTGADNSIDTGLHSLRANQFTGRLDHQLNPKEELFGRILVSRDTQTMPFVPDSFANNPPAPPGFGDDVYDSGVNLALGLTSIFRPTLINDFRFGYSFFDGTKQGRNIHSGFLQSLGINRAPGSTNDGIPAIAVPGYADLGDSDIFQPEVRKDHTFQFTDSLVWVKGRHTFQVGEDLRRLRLFYLVEDFGQGVFQFDDGASSVSGTAFSDFLLGRPFLSYAQAGNSGGNDRLDYLGAYLTDEFHVSPRLSLTYGLREEFYTPPVNIDGRASILDPTDAERFIVLNDHGQAATLTSGPLVQQLSSRYGLHFITSQQAGLPNSLIKPDWSNWAPRLGFAYDLTGDGKNALRGGVGVFNSLMELDYTAETRLSAPITDFLLGLDLCRFYGPGACGQSYAPPILTYQLGYTLGNQEPTAISSPPGIRNGYVYEWSLSYEHALTPNTVLSLSYTGSDGHKLPRRSLQNQGVPNLPGERLGYHPQPGSNQFVRATDVNSNYNALVARLERRLSGGLSFVAGYTYAKSLDTASGLDGTNQAQDNYNLRAEYGLSDFDMRQRVTFSGVWQLPFGAGTRWAQQGVASHILGQWQFANILSLQTGQPLTAVLSTALSGTQSNGTDRPDLIANPNLPGRQRGPHDWFNRSAFVAPPIFYDAQGAYSIPGNEGRNVITGPGLASWDSGLERHVRLTERLSTVFRAECFNLTNHPNFNRPGLIAGTTQFGNISSAGNSRQIQLSLRLNW
ncbi:MAG TPA: carboxypeptidase-like regulatory domain-containing protein [Terriglobia bacterium]|nr:carboxypeptidase-like regulatory domain-containing protein [Terriglobia bacterium]